MQRYEKTSPSPKHYTKTCISDLIFIPCNFDEHKHLHISFCWISTSNRASISQQPLAVQRQPICSDYTKSFTLNTPFHLAWRHQFVFKPNWMLYSSQIESCIQAKLFWALRQPITEMTSHMFLWWRKSCLHVAETQVHYIFFVNNSWTFQLFHVTLYQTKSSN